MKNILEPWRKFLIEQEAGVSGPEGVSKIATQPQRTLLTKFSLEKVKPTLMSLYANAFKKVERANYAKKGKAHVIAKTFLDNNEIKPEDNGMYAHYLDDIKVSRFNLFKRSKKFGEPKKNKKFLQWVYHTYIGPGFADSLRAVGAPNIFYYNHESNSIAPVSEASPKNPSLIFVSDGRGGVAMDPTSQGAFKGVFGSGRNVLEEFIKKKNLIANGVAVVGLGKFEDMRQAEFVTTEELDHVFEYLTTVAVKKQAALDKKEKIFKIRDKKAGYIIDRPEREYQAIVGAPRGFTPIDDLIGVTGNFIKAFWNKAAIDAGITGFKRQKTKMFKLYNKVVFNDDDEALPKAATVRKDYGVGRTETVKDMLDYMNMTQEIKIAIQFVMEKMRKKGVKSIDDLCAGKNFNLRQQIEQPDQSFKASMLVPVICKKPSLKVKDPLSGEGMTSEDFRKKLNMVYQERYLK